jgi:hemolysin activation/secretion protein
MRYKLVAPEFAALDGKGSSDTFGIDAMYPVLRTRTRNVYLNLNADHKRFENQSNGATQSRYTVNNLSAGVNGNLYDTLGGNSANNASLVWTRGRVNLGAPDANENKALEGSFNKLRYAFSRQQALGERLSLLVSVSGQASGSQLDSSEKFYLGGPSGVRAYPSSEGSGRSGTLASAELRWQVQSTFGLDSFWDHGTVRNPEAGGKSYSLKGYGLGVRWYASNSASVRIAWAHRIGQNPNPTATGNDQDGAKSLNRIWAAVNLPF